jgi:hypothetical protein
MKSAIVRVEVKEILEGSENDDGLWGLRGSKS